MTTRKERAEAKARRDEMKRRYPACRWCKKPVVAGQVDGTGQPSHYLCQVAFLMRPRKHPRAVPPNPRLPQLQHHVNEEPDDRDRLGRPERNP